MLNIIISNLLSNAIKFSNFDRTVRLTQSEDSDFFIFDMGDEGVGMSQEQIAMLFDFTVSATTLGTLGEKGTGLGLLICKEYVLMHGGNIVVHSQEEVGSHFIFTISKNLKPTGEEVDA